tara:strand:- start:14070 stop:14375 length:306 start_codon:yes stop_codon:yes gene_type:complete
MAYKHYTVQSWTNTPQHETMEHENEEGETISEEVEVSPITYNEDERFYNIGDAIEYYDTIDLSLGGAIIYYRLTVEGGYTIFRHSDIDYGDGYEDNILAQL